MKRMLAMLLAGVLAFTLGGCGQAQTGEAGGESSTDVSLSVDCSSGLGNTTQEPWGVESWVTATNSQGTSVFYISFPEFIGTSQGGGDIGEQPDGSIVIADGQNDTTPESVTSVSEVFPAYFFQAESVLRGLYRMRGDKYAFELADKSEIKINGYDMARFSGTLSYEYEREPVNCNWVAYATQLSENGAYAYWMVLDAARDKMTTANIAETAQKMAESFREEQE